MFGSSNYRLAAGGCHLSHRLYSYIGNYIELLCLFAVAIVVRLPVCAEKFSELLPSLLFVFVLLVVFCFSRSW
jgi:hypothetical protein